MEYITAKLYPGAFSDTEAAALRTISAAGVWNPRTCDLNGDQLRALLALRHAGYIEHAAHGGYKVRGNQYTVARASQPAAVLTILARYGITPAKPVIEVVSRTYKRPGPEPSWLVIRERNEPLPRGLADEFKSMYVDGTKLIIQLKAS